MKTRESGMPEENTWIIDLCVVNEPQGVAMRIVVNEDARKRSRVGNSPSASGTTAIGRQENRRGDGHCKSFRVFGEALEASSEGRRHGCLESQASSWSHAPFEHPGETKVGETPRGGTAQGRFPQRALDLCARCGGNRQTVSSFVPPVARLEDSPPCRLDLPETRAAGAGIGRRRHRALAEAGLVANKKGARDTLTPLVFLDESGFMLQPLRRRTWAPSGQTPLQRAWDRHERLSAISIICVSPLRHRLSHYFQVLRENVQTGHLVWFLRQLHHHYSRRVILIWDRSSVHRAAAGIFAENHPDWFTFEWLPSYSPELNPVEQSWKRTKYDDLPNFIPDNLQHLHDQVYESQKNQNHDQIILRSFFAHAKLTL
jgi:transposase